MKTSIGIGIVLFLVGIILGIIGGMYISSDSVKIQNGALVTNRTIIDTIEKRTVIFPAKRQGSPLLIADMTIPSGLDSVSIKNIAKSVTNAFDSLRTSKVEWIDREIQVTEAGDSLFLAYDILNLRFLETKLINAPFEFRRNEQTIYMPAQIESPSLWNHWAWKMAGALAVGYFVGHQVGSAGNDK